jgi:hypothetical protein
VGSGGRILGSRRPGQSFIKDLVGKAAAELKKQGLIR